MDQLWEEISVSLPISPEAGEELGVSRGGRPIRGFRIGRGDTRVSLIGGCHADEPVGPRLLRQCVGYLQSCPEDAAPVRDFQWWIVPHINPDGEAVNERWSKGAAKSYNLIKYLRYAVRELPGDDVEFGFPRSAGDTEARPENRAVLNWWREAAGPFHLHVSLHGMGFAGGPWFLIDPAWRRRCEHIKSRCKELVSELGYRLHDVERNGEKGFERIERGFCTRPNSRAMAEYFHDRNDGETAARFRPSSMETICSLGGDPLTLVSEMPLFILPGVGEDVGPPDPEAEKWTKRLEAWKAQLLAKRPEERIRACASSSAVKPMPIEHQMRLQWRFITAGIEERRMQGAASPTARN